MREKVSDLWVQEFLRELVVGVATLSDLARLILVEILHSVEGGNIEQVCSNLETILSCLRLLISLSLTHTHLCFISCICLLFISLICLIYLLLKLNMYAWVVCLLTLVFNQESNSGTSTLIEES